MIEIKFSGEKAGDVIAEVMQVAGLLQRAMAGPATQPVTGGVKGAPVEDEPSEAKAPLPLEQNREGMAAVNERTAIGDIDGVSGRSRNGLSTIGVDTLADIAKVTEAQMLDAKGVGKAAVDLLLDLAGRVGVSVGSDIPETPEAIEGEVVGEEAPESPADDLDKAIAEATAPTKPAARQPSEDDVRQVMTQLMARGPAAGKRFLEILNTLDAVDRKPGSTPIAKLALLKPERYAEAVDMANAAIAELDAFA